MKKRLFAGLLAMCLTVNLMSATAFATDATNEPVVTEDDQAAVGDLNALVSVASEGEENIYVAKIGDSNFETLQDAFSAAQNGNEVKILKAGTYELSTSGKDIIITGAVDGVVFDNIGAKNMGGADVTFNNITFDYYPNVNYTGLQHSGDLIYNACTFNGQVFLYGNSETFIHCMFNQASNDAYNVWTYGAKEVEFDDCTFNSAGKSVLIYKEGDDPDFVTDVSVTDTKFIASVPVDGKAAIEMDSSLIAGINLTIDGKTSTTGFGTGSVSGNSLWNNKKGSEGVNSDITVSVDREIVLRAAVTGLKGAGTETEPYLINDIYELKWFRDDVNNGNNYSGKYIKLTSDINLNGEEWIPIGTDSKPFKGKFDGNEKQIKNLLITGYNSNVGFFGNTRDGEIKNIVVCDAKVSGRLNVGVVAGTPYTTKYSNIVVKGHVEVNGMAYVGGVGGKNAYANWTDIIVDVDETSYVNANSVENGTAYRTYVGGVIGFMGEGGHTFKNITSNIDVTGSTIDIGGITGIAHYHNKFENVTCSGDVTSVDSNTETGGIAGVWNNAAGTSVTLTNCTFTGNVTAAGKNITATNAIAGAAYTVSNDAPENSGTLIINGIKVWPAVAKIGEATYGELSDAINAGGEIVVVRDVTVSDSIAIPTGKSVTLDLNGKTLNGNIFVESGAKAIVKNGKVVNENSSKSAIESNGELTVKDVTVTSARHAIRVEAGTAVIDGGNYSLITTNGMTQHVVNVSGTGTKVTIKAGTFVGPANSSSDSGAAVNVQAGATVTIEGGTFDGGKNDTLAAAGTLVVSAGKFDQNPAKYVVKTSHVIEKNGAFEVHTITYVAEKSASCKGTGTAAHYKCNTCGKLYKDAAGATEVTADKLVIGAKGHNYSTKSDASGHWSQCSRCGDVKDKEGHSYSNGKCSCGHETKVEVYVPETPTPAPTTPAPAPTTTTTTKTETTTTTKPVEAAKPAETPVEEVKVDTKIVEETATEEVKAVVKETVTVAEVKEVEKETEAGTVTVTEVKVAVTAETVDKVIENTEAGATVILPLTEAVEEGQAVTEAEIAVEALEKIVEAEAALTVEFEGVKVTLEADTIKAIAEQAQGSTIELRVVPVEHHELNEEQQNVLEAHDVAVRVSAQIFSDGEYIGDFKGGKATIAIPFTPEEGKAAEDHKVYFVDDNGEMTLMPAVYVDGHMVFETTHFSDYVIVYDEVASAEEGPSPVDDDMAVEAPVEDVQEEAGLPIVPIIIVVVAVILVVAFIATRNKKNEE